MLRCQLRLGNGGCIPGVPTAGIGTQQSASHPSNGAAAAQAEECWGRAPKGESAAHPRKKWCWWCVWRAGGGDSAYGRKGPGGVLLSILEDGIGVRAKVAASVDSMDLTRLTTSVARHKKRLSNGRPPRDAHPRAQMLPGCSCPQAPACMSATCTQHACVHVDPARNRPGRPFLRQKIRDGAGGEGAQLCHI